MKKYSRIFRYIGVYKGQVILYTLFILLSVVFSIVSLGMLMPFLELIFKGEQSSTSAVFQQSSNPAVKAIRDFVLKNIQDKGNGVDSKLTALGLICVLIIISIFL